MDQKSILRLLQIFKKIKKINWNKMKLIIAILKINQVNKLTIWAQKLIQKNYKVKLRIQIIKKTWMKIKTTRKMKKLLNWKRVINRSITTLVNLKLKLVINFLIRHLPKLFKWIKLFKIRFLQKMNKFKRTYLQKFKIIH